jgi:hypothetical protein
VRYEPSSCEECQGQPFSDPNSINESVCFRHETLLDILEGPEAISGQLTSA